MSHLLDLLAVTVGSAASYVVALPLAFWVVAR